MLSQTLLLLLLPLALALPQPSPRAACADMMVVFARGTTEAAPIGTVAGPPFKSALQSKIGGASLSFQGVSYPADIPGFLAGGDKAGSQTMAKMVSDAVASCPQAKIVMSGYSQGGQLVHNAAEILPADTMGKVSSVVIFGDPDNGKPVVGASSANTKVICHAGDNICQGGATILAPHLTYGSDAGTAAAFAASAAGF